MVESAVFQNLVSSFYSRLAQFAINSAGIVDQFEELRTGYLGSFKRLIPASKSFVGKIFRESRSCPTDTEPPTFEGRRFVSKASEIFLGLEHFHDLNHR